MAIRNSERAARSSDSSHVSERTPAALFGLFLATCIIELTLVWLTSLMPLRRFFPGPGVSVEFVEMLGPDWLRNTIWQASAFALLFAAFLPSLWLARRWRHSRAAHAIVFLSPVVWALTAAFMYPPYAVDLFHNLADSRLLWIYHLNPMVSSPILRPFPIGISFMNQPSAYGPFWYLLSFPASLFSPHDLLHAAVVLKIWTALFYLASGFVIYCTVRIQTKRFALLAATLYLWNPFVIVRALGDAHNDVFMMFFVLLAFYWIAKEQWLLVLPSLVLSVLIKYVSLLLIPLVLVYALTLAGPRRRSVLTHLVVGGMLALSLAVLIFSPFWDGARTFAALSAEGDKSITSTPLLVQYFITDRLVPADSAGLSRLWMRAIFAIPYIWLLWRVRPPQSRLQGSAFRILLLYILIAAAWFRPWYFLWVISIGALLPWGRYLALSLVLSWFGMFPDIVEQYRVHSSWLAAGTGRLLLAPVVVAFLPATLLLLWDLWRGRPSYSPSSAQGKQRALERAVGRAE